MATEPNREPALTWLKSSTSADAGNCVEVAYSESCVLVRDSGDRSGTILEISPGQWRRFVRRIKDGKTVLG